MSSADLDPLWLTLRLAGVTTPLLLAVGTPLAWWLARTASRLRPPIEAVVALPLVLPPTVLGFYLLVLLGPRGALGTAWQALGLEPPVFSFSGLVIGSVLYSLPFVVQPLQTAFEGVGRLPLEVAATLRAGPWDRFATVAVPLARRGFLTAATLGFAHTLGEFGVVLMIGGNIPGRTRVLSIAIYDHVERLEYAQAHRLSLGMLVFSFAVLWAVYALNSLQGRGGREDRDRRGREPRLLPGPPRPRPGPGGAEEP
jgi:molybdate transport system permease protein